MWSRANAIRPDNILLHSNEMTSVSVEVWFKEET